MNYQKQTNSQSAWALLFTLSIFVVFTSCKKEDDPEPSVKSSDLHGTWVYNYEYDDGDSTYSINDTLFIDSDMSFNYSINTEYSSGGGWGSSSESTDDDDNAVWTFDETSQRFIATMPWISGDLEIWSAKVNAASSTGMEMNQDETTGWSDQRVGMTVNYIKI